MITVQDLRIGNYHKASIEWRGSMQVQIDPIGEERIFLLTEEKLLLILQFAPKTYEWIYPVELSEDWLLKFGFEKGKICIMDKYSAKFNEARASGSSIDICYKLDKFIIVPRMNMAVYVEKLNVSTLEQGLVIIEKTKYVYQLQNLYKDLENKELIVK